MKTDKQCLEHIEAVIWDPTVPDHEKVLCIQNLLYQRDQILDKRTEDMFGSDQRPLGEAGARRL